MGGSSRLNGRVTAVVLLGCVCAWTVDAGAMGSGVTAGHSQGVVTVADVIRLGAAALRSTECPRDRILVIGHRGLGPGTRRLGGHRYSEDTIPGFKRAMDAGADGFETDYWPSSDDLTVSHHDPTLDRMTSGSGRIPQRAWGYISGVRNNSGAPVPTFGAVQKAMKARGGHRQQEIKDGDVFGDATLRRMIAIDRHTVADVDRQVLFTSSQMNTLRRIDRLGDGIPVGLIHRTSRGRPTLSTLPGWLDVVLIDFTAADRDYIRRAHRAGLKVSLRGVNTVHRLHRAVAIGADRAVTDVPDALGRAC